jgi:hypothetical protein
MVEKEKMMTGSIQDRRGFIRSGCRLIASAFGLAAVAGPMSGTAQAQPLDNRIFIPPQPVVSKWYNYEGKLDDGKPIRVTLGLSPALQVVSLSGDIGGGARRIFIMPAPARGRNIDLFLPGAGVVGGTDWPHVANDRRSLRGSVSIEGKEYRYAATLKGVVEPPRLDGGMNPGGPRLPSIDPRLQPGPVDRNLPILPPPEASYPPSPVPALPPSPPLPQR